MKPKIDFRDDGREHNRKSRTPPPTTNQPKRTVKKNKQKKQSTSTFYGHPSIQDKDSTEEYSYSRCQHCCQRTAIIYRKMTCSLPSLWGSSKDSGKTKPWIPSLSLTSSSIAAAPVSMLSKSAPALLKPLLDSSALLQARANIQNRLMSLEAGDGDKRQKMPPTLPPTTAKCSSSLINRYHENSTLSRFKPPLLSKQSTLLPIPSKSRQRLERIDRQSSRRSRCTRAGSEDSNSSSSLDDEAVPEAIHNTSEDIKASVNIELENFGNVQSFFRSLFTKAAEDTSDESIANVKDYNKSGDDPEKESP
ncbi:hypothetical protein DNTS_016373, partial [Danionella cerebrum]